MILVDLHGIDDADQSFTAMLIVAMSWSVFWIDPENVGARTGMATSSMLTLIAYRFISGNSLPGILHLTELDYLIPGSTTPVFLALIEAVMASSVAKGFRPC